MAASVPQAVQSCHELLLWLIPQLDKLPCARRFTLGERIEAGVIEVLELLVEAAYTRNKETPLRRANLRLEIVRHLWRVGFELKDIATRQYDQISDAVMLNVELKLWSTIFDVWIGNENLTHCVGEANCHRL